MKHRATRSGRPRGLVPAAMVVAALGLWALAAAVVALAMPDDASTAGAAPPTSAPFALVDSPNADELAAPGEFGTEPPATDVLPSESPTGAGEAAPATKRLADVMSGDTVLRVGDSGLPVKFVQQRLNMAGIETPENSQYDAATEASVNRLQEKFDLNRSGRLNRYTLNTLLHVTERGPALPAECLAGTVLCVDKTQKIVRLVIDGAPEITLDARFGAFGSATDEGAFTVYDKRADDWSEEFGVPMQYSLYFSGGQAIHYSDFFAEEGYTGASRGCVNTRDLDATATMFDLVDEGTAVFVYQ
ncbi:MAG: murein L,D-transpeptidase [Actinobacteria bacterium]|nr:murein L,D-transpeptidase [Actinomycetota bacterium]